MRLFRFMTSLGLGFVLIVQSSMAQSIASQVSEDSLSTKQSSMAQSIASQVSEDSLSTNASIIQTSDNASSTQNDETTANQVLEKPSLTTGVRASADQAVAAMASVHNQSNKETLESTPSRRADEGANSALLISEDTTNKKEVRRDPGIRVSEKRARRAQALEEKLEVEGQKRRKNTASTGSVIEKVDDYFYIVGDIIQVVIFMSGVVVCIMGVFQYSNYRNNPKSTTSINVILYFVLAGLLMSVIFFPTMGSYTLADAKPAWVDHGSKV